MADKTGGPAFPPHGYGDDDRGMTLRDYFAAQALAGMLSVDADTYVAQVDAAKKHRLTYEKASAVKSYAIADAMLAEREKVD